MTFGSLFAGIGGMDLGLERAGLRCQWQVEIDGYARSVLAKHGPDVWRWDDVRTFPDEPLGRRAVDLICGGFPCQDISRAGSKDGITGSKSSLWGEFARIIRNLRPRFVLVENSADLLVRGIDRVLGDLASLGFDAEWSVVSACSVGAPHTRERVFIVAHADGSGFQNRWAESLEALAAGGGKGQAAGDVLSTASDAGGGGRWAVCPTESGVGRVADGVPSRVDRLGRLGNAVVPQVAEWIGRRLMKV